jgi:hypothetical protein
VGELLQKGGKPEPLSSKTAKTGKSILDDLGSSKSTDGVTAGNLTYDSHSGIGEFSFSLVNQLRESVSRVYCLAIFYDTEGSPIDISVVQFSGAIPPGLAKRLKGQVADSTEKLNRPMKDFDPPPRKPRGKVEFRILDFTIAE